MSQIKRIKLFVIGFAVMFAAFLLVAPTADAATAANCKAESSNFLGFPTWYKYLDPTFENGECKIDIEIPGSLTPVLFAVLEILLRIVGIISVVFVIYGGFIYLITTGEPEKAKNARTTIFNAVVGLVVAMLATVIVNLVARSVV